MTGSGPGDGATAMTAADRMLLAWKALADLPGFEPRGAPRAAFEPQCGDAGPGVVELDKDWLTLEIAVAGGPPCPLALTRLNARLSPLVKCVPGEGKEPLRLRTEVPLVDEPPDPWVAALLGGIEASIAVVTGSSLARPAAMDAAKRDSASTVEAEVEARLAETEWRVTRRARLASERACLREIEGRVLEGRSPGIRVADVLDAVADECQALARALTPASCHRHLEGLAPDQDVVRVGRVTRRARGEPRYLTAV